MKITKLFPSNVLPYTVHYPDYWSSQKLTTNVILLFWQCSDEIAYFALSFYLIGTECYGLLLIIKVNCI